MCCTGSIRMTLHRDSKADGPADGPRDRDGDPMSEVDSTKSVAMGALVLVVLVLTLVAGLLFGERWP